MRKDYLPIVYYDVVDRDWGMVQAELRVSLSIVLDYLGVCPY
jgi:hypothetical protein